MLSAASLHQNYSLLKLQERISDGKWISGQTHLIEALWEYWELILTHCVHPTHFPLCNTREPQLLWLTATAGLWEKKTSVDVLPVRLLTWFQYVCVQSAGQTDFTSHLGWTASPMISFFNYSALHHSGGETFKWKLWPSLTLSLSVSFHHQI